MPKFSALMAVVLALLIVPALAAAAPTGSQITTPATTAYVTFEQDNPGSLHVAGTTVGGTGNVDLRCYSGGKSPLVASNVPVSGGAFSVDVPVNQGLMTALGAPYPFCMLRAVPAGTNPAAPIDLPSDWQGVFVGWGFHDVNEVGPSFAPTPSDSLYDFFIARAQSKAFNDYDSIASCGLCDTYLFVPGSGAASNPIWWANDALYLHPTGVTSRTAVRVDGADAYTAGSAHAFNPNWHPVDNPGYPALSVTDTVQASTGDLRIEESAPYVHCAEDRTIFPPTDASCASFADTGVHYERSIRQTDSGRVVTIVDHWKSVDGKAHDLDAIYEDTERSENAAISGHEARADFTWTPGGFRTYPANTQIPLPPVLPASVLVKTDASTPAQGDSMNPYGAMSFGSKPSEIKLVRLADASNKTGAWQTRYERTIPAGGEISIAVAYVHDFDQASTIDKWIAADVLISSPAIAIDAPADGSTIDGASAHVTGTASSPDGELAVNVNGAAAAVTADGHWSADVPLSEGANQIMAVARNDIGVTTTAIRSVTRPAAPAPAATPASAAVTVAAPVAAAARPVRCVVPKLRGKTLPKATRLLKRAHCRLGKVARKASKRVKAGHVLTTRFKAGTRHRAGTRIRVTVAKAA